MRNILILSLSLFVGFAGSTPAIKANFDTGASPELVDATREAIGLGKAHIKDRVLNAITNTAKLVITPVLAPIKNTISHYRDPRLFGLIGFSGLIGGCGAYFLCKEKNTTSDKIKASVLFAVALANIMLSHYTLGVIDHYFPSRSLL